MNPTITFDQDDRSEVEYGSAEFRPEPGYATFVRRTLPYREAEEFLGEVTDVERDNRSASPIGAWYSVTATDDEGETLVLSIFVENDLAWGEEPAQPVQVPVDGIRKGDRSGFGGGDWIATSDAYPVTSYDGTEGMRWTVEFVVDGALETRFAPLGETRWVYRTCDECGAHHTDEAPIVYPHDGAFCERCLTASFDQADCTDCGKAIVGGSIDGLRCDLCYDIVMEAEYAERDRADQADEWVDNGWACARCGDLEMLEATDEETVVNGPLVDGLCMVCREDDEAGRSLQDWRQEVANGDTSLGYSEWVVQQEEADLAQQREDAYGTPGTCDECEAGDLLTVVSVGRMPEMPVVLGLDNGASLVVTDDWLQSLAQALVDRADHLGGLASSLVD